MSWSLFLFSLEGDRSHHLDINLLYPNIMIPLRCGLAASWLDAQLILQLAQLSNSIKIHTNHNLVCLKKSSKSGLSLHLSTAWDEVELFL